MSAAPTKRAQKRVLKEKQRSEHPESLSLFLNGGDGVTEDHRIRTLSSDSKDRKQNEKH